MKKSVQFLLLFLMCISASWTWASDAPERTVLFNMGDYDSQYWRIPALVTAADNSLVAVVDKRGSSLGDLPNTISIMSRRSTDNGKNWSEPVVVAQGGNGKTYGDPAVVLDKKTGNLICMFVGDQGLWNATPYNRQGIYVSKSTDNGVSWSEPVAITDQVYANHSSWYAGFAGSGHGLCLKDGRLMFVLAIRATSATGVPLHNYAIYSDDGGDNWTLSTNAATTAGDEAKVVELEDGDILMSIRNPSKGNRIFCKSTDRGQTWGKAYFETELKDPACNGDIIRYSYSTDEGSEGKSRLLHSLPESTTTRENVTIYLSEDDGETWPIKKRLVDGYSAYSSLTVLSDGTIGALVEEGKWDSNLPGEDGFQLVFYRFTMDWLTSDVTEPPVVSEGTLQLNGTDRYMRIPSADDFNIAIGESYTVTCKVKMPFSGSSCRFVSKRSYTGTANSGTVGWEMWGDMNASTRFSTNLSPAGSPWGGKGNASTIIGGSELIENQTVVLVVFTIVIGNIEHIQELPPLQIYLLGRIRTLRFYRTIETTLGRAVGRILPLEQFQTSISRYRFAGFVHKPPHHIHIVARFRDNDGSRVLRAFPVSSYIGMGHVVITNTFHMLYADQLADFTRIQYLFKRNEIRGIPQDVANAYNTVIALGVFQNIRTLFYRLGDRFLQQQIVSGSHSL